jgi:putative heme iron utilization protein
MSNVVKQGDTHAVTFTVLDDDGAPVDLAGATVRVLAVLDSDPDQTLIVLDATLGAGAGEVVHQLTGTLPVGTYTVVVEETRGAVVTTAPSQGYVTLRVTSGLG